MITLDFDPAEEAQGLPEGTYEFQVAVAEETQSAAGNPMASIACEVINHPELNGRRVFDNIAFIPKAAWKLMQFTAAIGLQPSRQIDVASWLGRTGYMTIEMDSSYDGTPRPKVAKYKRSM